MSKGPGGAEVQKPLTHLGSRTCIASVTGLVSKDQLDEVEGYLQGVPDLWPHAFTLGACDVANIQATMREMLGEQLPVTYVECSITTQSALMNSARELISVAARKVRTAFGERTVLTAANNFTCLTVIGALHKHKVREASYERYTDFGFESLGTWDLSQRPSADSLLNELTPHMQDDTFLQGIGLREFLRWKPSTDRRGGRFADF